MMAADSSSISAYFKGLSGRDVEAVDSALRNGGLAVAPAVITEVLSGPNSPGVESVLLDLSVLEIMEGYWMRAGRTRRLLLARGFKAKVADALIAQSCIDNDVALITRDTDFRHFATHCGLKLA
jgi:predicted nucleic acid-binding protein